MRPMRPFSSVLLGSAIGGLSVVRDALEANRRHEEAVAKIAAIVGTPKAKRLAELAEITRVSLDDVHALLSSGAHAPRDAKELDDAVLRYRSGLN